MYKLEFYRASDLNVYLGRQREDGHQRKTFYTHSLSWTLSDTFSTFANVYIPALGQTEKASCTIVWNQNIYQLDRHWCHSHGKSSFILYTNWTVVKACERGYAMPSISSSWCMYCNHHAAGNVEQACTNVPLVKFFCVSLWSVLSDRQAGGTPLGPVQDRSPGVPYHWDAASVLPSRELQGRQGESDVSGVTLWIMSHDVTWLICNMMSWWLVRLFLRTHLLAHTHTHTHTHTGSLQRVFLVHSLYATMPTLRVWRLSVTLVLYRSLWMTSNMMLTHCKTLSGRPARHLERTQLPPRYLYYLYT